MLLDTAIMTSAASRSRATWAEARDSARRTLAVLALTLAACGGSDDSASPPAAVPPFAITGATALAEVGAPLQLGSSVSPATAGFTYRWDFGDGTSSMAASPAKTYATPGTYTLSLTITGATGDSKTASADVVAGRYSLVQGQRCMGAAPNSGWCRLVRLPYIQGDLHFVDASHGWAIGRASQLDDRGKIYRTSDGGQTWTASPIGTTAARSLVFANADIGAALADGNGSEDTDAWATRDGGRTWKLAGALPRRTDSYESRPTPLSISADGSRILLQREKSARGFPPEPRKPEGIYLSRDGGATWYANETASALTPDGTLFELDGDRVLRSTGPGQTPTVSALSDAQSLRLIAFSSDRNGWVFGSTVRAGLAVWQTVDGGTQWRRVDIQQSTDRPTCWRTA